MGMDLGVFITYVGILVMFFVCGKLFYFPLKVAAKLVINSIIGGALLVAISIVGTGFGICIPLNVLNACIVGILGVPGIIMLLILTW